MDLSRNETRMLINALCGEREKLKEELTSECFSEDREYKKLSDLIGKLIDHINKLPY